MRAPQQSPSQALSANEAGMRTARSVRLPVPMDVVRRGCLHAQLRAAHRAPCRHEIASHAFPRMRALSQPHRGSCFSPLLLAGFPKALLRLGSAAPVPMAEARSLPRTAGAMDGRPAPVGFIDIRGGRPSFSMAPRVCLLLMAAGLH